MWTFRKRNAIYKRFPESVQSRCLPSLQLVTRLDQFPKDASREGFAGGSSKKLSISRFPSETANKYNVSKRHPLSFSQTSKLQGCNDGLSMTFESALKRCIVLAPCIATAMGQPQHLSTKPRVNMHSGYQFHTNIWHARSHKVASI